MTTDNEIPLPTLACNLYGIQADNNRSVSEGVKRVIEPANSWCRNILADPPSRAKSSDHGKKVSGEVGGNRFTIRLSPGMRRAGVTDTNKVDGRYFKLGEFTDVSILGHVRPLLKQ